MIILSVKLSHAVSFLKLILSKICQKFISLYFSSFVSSNSNMTALAVFFIMLPSHTHTKKLRCGSIKKKHSFCFSVK